MAGAVNIRFGASVGGFSLGIGQMRADLSGLVTQLNGNLAAGFAAADRNQRIYGKGLGRLGAEIQSFGRQTSIISAGIALVGAASFKSYAQIDGIQRALKVVAGSAEEANKQFGEFRERAKLPGLGLEEVVSAGLQLETLGYQAQTAQKYISEIGNAIALGGKGKVEFGSVITQITQMSGKAKVLSEDLKPILTASPVISKAITDMFGAVDPEQISAKLQAAGRGPKDFIEDLVKTLSQLERVKGGPKNALENLSDSFVNAGYEAGKVADSAFGLTKKIDGLGTFVNSAASSISKMSPELQTLTLGLTGVAFAIPPLALGLGTLIQLGPGFVKGFGAMKGAALALTTPFGAIAVAATAAFGLFALIGTSVEHYSAGLETSANRAKLFASVTEQVSTSIATETSKLNSLLSIAKDETVSRAARLQAVKDLNALSPQYLGNLQLETVNTQQATTAVTQYANALRLKAKVQILSQQSAQSEIDLAKLEAKSAKDFVDRSGKFSPDQIAINLKTPVFTSDENAKKTQDRLFDELGKRRKDAAVKLLKDEARFYNEQYKKTFAEAVNQNVTLDPPKIKAFNYLDTALGSESDLKKAKDRLKKLREEIFAGDKAGLNTSALKNEARILKEQIDAVGKSIKGPVASAGEEVGTYFDYASERLAHFNKVAESYAASDLAIPNIVTKSITYFGSEVEKGKNALLALKKIDLGELNPVKPTGIATPTFEAVSARPFNALDIGIASVINKTRLAHVALKGLGTEARLSMVKQFGTIDYFQEQITKLQSAIGNLSLKNLAIPPNAVVDLAAATGQVKKYNEALAAAEFAAEELRISELPKLFGIKIGGLDISVFNDSVAQMGATLRNLKLGIGSALKDAAQTAFVGMGEVIGGLISGTNGIGALPGVLLGTLGGMLKQLGTIAIQAAIGLTAIQTALKTLNPAVALVAGVGLIALGTAIQTGVKKLGATAFEAGGLITGPTYAFMGETPKARAGGGEYVASVELGSNLIGDRILKKLTAYEVKTPDLRISDFERRSQSVDVTGEFRIQGTDLVVVLERARAASNAYN